MQIWTDGFDLAKNVSLNHGVKAHGMVMPRKELKRGKRAPNPS